MNCPKCKSKVIKDRKRRYETLVEHVSDPNQFMNSSPPLRDTYICPNHCYPHTYWDIYGDAYVHTPFWMRIMWKITNYKYPKYPKSKDIEATPWRK